MTKETGIDLNFCVPGQKVRLRDGEIGTYQGFIIGHVTYPHEIAGFSYTSDGCFWDDNRISKKDVVEILPMEEESVKPTEVKQRIAEQLDVAEPDHVSVIPQPNGVLISIKKDNTTINWRHYNS